MNLENRGSLSPEYLKKAAKAWLELRERGRTDLFWLVNEVLSPADSRILAHHAHDCIIDHCQKFAGRKEYANHTKMGKNGAIFHIAVSQPRVPMAELKGTRDNLLLVSRGHLKTTCHVVGHTIQWIINYPDVRILLATATDEKAQLMMTEIRGHFQFNSYFRFLYPEFCPDAKKASDFGSKSEFTVPNRVRKAKEPTVMTAAVGKALASTHHDVIKASDVVTENNVRTPGQIQEVKDFFGYMDPLREKFESKDGKPNPGWLDVEGTIYDFGDYYQALLDDIKGGRKQWWKVTKQSCWMDKARRVSLWPERFPPEQLDRIADQIGPVLFASQYELHPISLEEGLVDNEKQVRFFRADIISELMPRYRIYTTVDLAGMDPQSDGDYTVFTTCGFDRDGRCDVLSIARGRFSQDEVINLFFSIDSIYPNHVGFKVQKDHFARMLATPLAREQAKRGKWMNIIQTPIDTRISKVHRIKQLRWWFVQGIIRFADNLSCKHDLMLEILRFPRGDHDDILDTLADQMHNREGGVSVDVYPDPPKFAFGMPVQENRFLGFDPITAEQKWLHDQIENAHSEYNAMTGAL